VTSIGNSMFALPPSYSGIAKLQDQFNQLQTQLATGKKASTLADLGSSRYSDLTVRSQLTRIGAYDNNITTVNLRINMLNQVLTSLSTVNSDARATSTAGSYGTDNVNLATAPSIALNRLDQVLSTLNTDINGHYLLGGGATDHAPVVGSSAALDGAGGLDGFRTVAAQRLQADQGADGLGRLTLSTASDTVTVAEDGAHPFGFKLSTLSSTNSSLTLTQPSGSPASMAVQFTAQPNDGDELTVGLTLPDGTSDSLTMKAVAGTPANPGEFQIGATAAATAANFSAALQSSLQTEGQTTLAVASNYAAATNFFNGQGSSVQRVAVNTADNTFYTATGYETAAQTAATTVQWYSGQDSNGAARASVSSKVDDTTNVDYGVEANEYGFTQLVRSLAVQSIQTYSTSTTAQTAQSQAKFDAVAQGQLVNLSSAKDSTPGSIAAIGVDLGLAQTTLKNLTSQHTAYSAQLQDVLSNVETADPTTVASELLELQTRLSASYQATSMISQLQLVNYLK
jgi:flagellin-like hook-associated protein FlgL